MDLLGCQVEGSSSLKLHLFGYILFYEIYSERFHRKIFSSNLQLKCLLVYTPSTNYSVWLSVVGKQFSNLHKFFQETATSTFSAFPHIFFIHFSQQKKQCKRVETFHLNSVFELSSTQYRKYFQNRSLL